MLTQVQIISLSLSPTATGKTELLLERPAVRTNSVGGRKGVVSGEFSPLLPHSLTTTLLLLLSHDQYTQIQYKSPTAANTK